MYVILRRDFRCSGFGASVQLTKINFKDEAMPVPGKLLKPPCSKIQKTQILNFFSKTYNSQYYRD